MFRSQLWVSVGSSLGLPPCTLGKTAPTDHYGSVTRAAKDGDLYVCLSFCPPITVVVSAL